MILTATLNVLEVYDFIELKCESDHTGEHATGHIRSGGVYPPKSWDLGPKDGQDFWVWWDNLQGKVNLTLEADGVVIFQGECVGNAGGEVRLEDTSASAFIKRDGSPRLERNTGDTDSFIRF